MSSDRVPMTREQYDRLKADLERMQTFEMVEVAKRTVVVADSSKFGRRSLSRIVPPSALHQIITDRGIPKSDLRTLKKAGIEVTLV